MVGERGGRQRGGGGGGEREREREKVGGAVYTDIQVLKRPLWWEREGVDRGEREI